MMVFMDRMKTSAEYGLEQKTEKKAEGWKRLVGLTYVWNLCFFVSEQAKERGNNS